MKKSFMGIAPFLVIHLLLGSCLAASRLLAASSDPGSLKAKGEAKTQGYTFLTTNDEIVAGAKKEGRLRVASQFDPSTNKAWIGAFKKRYPFMVDVHVDDATGTDPQQRFLLELKTGRPTGWDVYDIAPDFYAEFLPYIRKFDILGMAAAKILAIPTAMIDPQNRNAVSIASSAHGIAYNRKLIPEDKLPKSWEDFLKPDLKGRKFLVDTRPQGFAALAAGLGEKWTLDYAKRIASQEPVWVRGQSRYFSSIADGEYPLFHLAYHYSCVRTAKKVPTEALGCKVIEPVPIRIQNFLGVNNTAQHPYSGLLWLEFLASPEGQKLIDDFEEFNTSLYSPGSKLAKLIEGKKVSVNSWDTIHNSDKWQRMVTEAFGFPTAQK
jgi:ABC-type Fe3+ transport system substrate-binding protein